MTLHGNQTRVLTTGMLDNWASTVEQHTWMPKTGGPICHGARLLFFEATQFKTAGSLLPLTAAIDENPHEDQPADLHPRTTEDKSAAHSKDGYSRQLNKFHMSPAPNRSIAHILTHRLHCTLRSSLTCRFFHPHNQSPGKGPQSTAPPALHPCTGWVAP